MTQLNVAAAGSSTAPTLWFTAQPLTGPGIPTEDTDGFRLQLDQAVSGGGGTAAYLGHIQKLADFSAYLKKEGGGAFTESDGPGGGRQAVASDGTTTMTVGVLLDAPTTAAAGDAPPVRGVATVRLALPHPYEMVRIAQFAVTLAELPAGFVLTQQVWASLMSPLVSRLSTFVRSAVDTWLETDVGEDVSALGDALEAGTGDVAADVAEDTAAALVEDAVVAEVAIDLAAAVPALAGLAVLMAIPLLIAALAKNFVLHVEVDNVTDHAFTWSIPYVDQGAVTVQPADAVLPAMGTVTDAWGDTTTVPVVFQASFSAANTSGFAGLGFVLNLSAQGIPGQDLAAVISIPWAADNGIWLGQPGGSPDWGALYAANSGSTGALRVSHGTQHFVATLAIDALAGHGDEYHCVLRIQPL
jgi:hypothetical protein